MQIFKYMFKITPFTKTLTSKRIQIKEYLSDRIVSYGRKGNGCGVAAG